MMQPTLTKGMISFIAVGFFFTLIFFASGCAGNRIQVGYDNDDSYESSQENSEHKPQKGGPPAHAPAHGYRAKHHYHYYPSASVYYDNERELYFYLEGDNWEVSVSLPGSIRVRLGDYVSIEMETDRPYLYHAEHVKKYPPGQMKKKNKKKYNQG
ncbi:MAG: hypothetical protein JRH12_16120 [Deltaproteobacteria bacterium]|jgi:hypothetical protein|nr:hypothetical protein [Deltaproteobacteria bacterium]MBW2478489.1 hypothetical protein [Deltaproteobacteria bacterium]